MYKLNARVFDKILDKMGEVLSIDFHFHEISYKIDENIFAKNINSDEIVIMYSTNMFDETGIEIFEKDIVKIMWEDSSKWSSTELVKWTQEEFYYGWSPFCIVGHYNGCDDVKIINIKVIGNEFKTPELIKRD